MSSEPPDELVDHYYEIVVNHLRQTGTWSKVIQKIPPAAIRAAVRNILRRLAQSNETASNLDWGSLFENLADFSTVNDFLEWATSNNYIPPDYEELMEKYTSDMEEQLNNILDYAKSAPRNVKQEIYSRLREFLGVEDQIKNLKSQLEKYKSDAARYAELLKEEADKVAQLRNEVEELRRQLQGLPQQTLKPVVMTFEEAWRMFCSQLKEIGIDCNKYRNDEDIRNGVMAAARARNINEAEVIIRDLVSTIERQARERGRKQARPSAAPSTAAGTVISGRVFVAPSSIPVDTIRQALIAGAVAMGLGQAEIAAIADRLKSIAELMKQCRTITGATYEDCVTSTRFAGDILEFKALEVAQQGLRYLTDNAGSYQASLKDFAIERFTSLRRLLALPSDAMIMGEPLYYWLAVVATYEIAYYFNLRDMIDSLQSDYERFKRYIGV